jgi:anti-sigma factor RsiW
MNCPNRERLVERAAGRLEGEAAGEVERHLAGCSECQEWLASQAGVWAALDGWPPPPVSEDFDRRLYARLEEEDRRGRRWAFPWRVFRLRPVLSWALAAMLVFAAVLLERPKAPPPPGRGRPAVETIDPDRLERALDDVEMLRQTM